MVIFRVFKKFSTILSKHQKLRIIELFVFMVAGGFMEMLSVSMMIPFVSTMVDPDASVKNETIAIIMHAFGIESFRSFLVFLAIIMAALYLMKNAFLLFQMTVQEKFVRGNMFDTQRKLLRSYLARPYEYYMSVQSGEIVRVISKDTENAFFVLTTLMSFCSELIVSIILLTTIFVMAPTITLIMGGVLLGITILIFSLTKRKLRKVGVRNVNATARMNQTLIQSIQGIREIKIMRRESFFQKRYETDGKEIVKCRYTNQLLSLSPRFMLEAFAMSTFLLIVAFMLYHGAEVETILPMVSGIAMASVRLLPSMNRLSIALANLTYYEPSLDKLLENIKSSESGDIKRINDSRRDTNLIGSISKNIVFDNVTYQYPTSEKPVLSRVNLVIQRGQSVGIVGASGSGKTTLVDLALGLLKPQEGQVLVDGFNIEDDLNGWLSQVGYIPQSIFLLDGSIRENVAFGANSCESDDTKIWKALEEASLKAYVQSLPEQLDTQIGERGIRLSGGQKQRIGIARALYAEPEVLFFDEATSALDNDTESAIMDSIKLLQGNKTILIIAHRLTTIENCDVVYRVEDGDVAKER